MKKGFTVLIMLLIIITFSGGMNAKADSSYKNLRIGLRNMVANSIKITLNGNYNVDGIEFYTGTSDVVTITKGKLLFENQTFDNITLIPEKQENTIKLEVGAKKYTYRGSISFDPTSNGILPINIIDIETYLKGVVGFEMSNSYPLEALKAQAVAARSYALASINKHNSVGYDLCDTTDCQVYRGYISTFDNVIRAVDETKNKVLVYGNELVCAFFSASSGGYTEASGNIWRQQLPYLIAKKDDMENENWPYGNMIFTNAQIETKIKSKNYLKASDKFLSIDINSIKRDESGRVASLDIIYTNAQGNSLTKSITKENARTFLSLPSALYTISYDINAGTYTFSGKGYGHGVGLSQVGAKNRANAGQAFESILQFYYDGTKLSDMNGNIRTDSSEITITTDNAIGIGTSTGGGVDLQPKSTTGTSIDKVPVTSSGGISLPVTTGSSINVIPLPKENQDNVPKPIIVIKPSLPSNNVIRKLKKGVSGTDVKQLQEALKKLKFLNIKNTTNFFGDTTEKAVKNFQRNNGVKINGVVDKATLNLINRQLLLQITVEQSKS